MNFVIALGITEDVDDVYDGTITETNNFSSFSINGHPAKISAFYIGY